MADAGIARAAIIGEQNKIIAAAYDALLKCAAALGEMPAIYPTSHPNYQAFAIAHAAIDQIGDWKQHRDPAAEQNFTPPGCVGMNRLQRNDSASGKCTS
jgi:hypothetical protein